MREVLYELAAGVEDGPFAVGPVEGAGFYTGFLIVTNVPKLHTLSQGSVPC